MEMWTGKWRKAKTPDGKETYAKNIINVPLEKNVGGHGGVNILDWWQTAKGFKHPYDPPEHPSDVEVRTLERKASIVHDAIYARAAAEGLDAEKFVGKAERPTETEAVGEKLPDSVFALKALARKRGIDISDISGKGAKAKIVERLTAPVGRTNRA